MITVVIMLVGIVAGMCLAYLVESAYTEAAPKETPSRKCSNCKWRKRFRMRSLCTSPAVRDKAGCAVTCVKAITEVNLCGLCRSCFEPFEK